MKKTKFEEAIRWLKVHGENPHDNPNIDYAVVAEWMVLFYEELKVKIKAKEEIPKSKTIIVEEDSGYRYEVKTDDECNLKLATDLKYAKQKIIELNDKINRLTSELHYTEEIIRDVKKMNYFNFRRWKKDT